VFQRPATPPTSRSLIPPNAQQLPLGSKAGENSRDVHAPGRSVCPTADGTKSGNPINWELPIHKRET